jgi:oligopeptide/dipeptide ABC transporter ATP-binding protein
MIALALAGDPRLLIADEPTTALDLVTQATILSLLRSLASEERAGLLLITHDLSIVGGLVDRVLVLYAGRVVEEGPTAELFSRPLHPYTRFLLSSVPGHGRRRRPEDDPSPAPPPTLGCRFAPRCSLAVPSCLECEPELRPSADGRRSRCPVTSAVGEDGGDG